MHYFTQVDRLWKRFRARSRVGEASTLDEPDQAVADSGQLTDEQKLDAAGDISAIRAQVAKKNPNPSAIRGAWEGLKALPVLGKAAEAVAKVSKLLASLLP